MSEMMLMMVKVEEQEEERGGDGDGDRSRTEFRRSSSRFYSDTSTVDDPGRVNEHMPVPAERSNPGLSPQRRKGGGCRPEELDPTARSRSVQSGLCDPVLYSTVQSSLPIRASERASHNSTNPRARAPQYARFVRHVSAPTARQAIP